jgi:hypothetical protein
MRRWIMSHVGRRGAFLLFLAVLNFTWPFALHVQAVQHLRTNFLLPWQAWAIWWGATGLIDLVGAFSKRDVWAFTASSMLKVAWASTYLVLWVRGQPYAWFSVVIWLPFAAMVLIVASWPEVVDTPIVTNIDIPGGQL